MNKYSGDKVSTFRERFTELCDSNPMNDTALADALQVSKQTVSAWKTGTRSPKAPTIIAIADYFHVSVQWIMGFDVEKILPSQHVHINDADINVSKDISTPRTLEARILAKGIDSMPQSQREAIMNMMMGLYPNVFKKGTENDDT